jgi:hypothetical protein
LSGLARAQVTIRQLPKRNVFNVLKIVSLVATQQIGISSVSTLLRRDKPSQ